jgi:hypothetical protein
LLMPPPPPSPDPTRRRHRRPIPPPSVDSAIAQSQSRWSEDAAVVEAIIRWLDSPGRASFTQKSLASRPSSSLSSLFSPNLR